MRPTQPYTLIAAGLIAAGLSFAGSIATAQTNDPAGNHGGAHGTAGGPGGAGPNNMSSVGVAKKAMPASPDAMSGVKHGTDTVFVDKAAMGGVAEVKLGQLAQQKGSSDQVKTFGQKMVDDHSKANDQLKAIATGKGMDVPADMEPKAKAAMDKLSKLSGAAFDSAYMKMMVADHKEDIALFEKEAASGTDADLKAFAAKTLPTLHGHLKMAQGGKSTM